MAGAPSPAFRGRARERHQLDSLLDGTRRSESAVLVLRGEAGIGKTALLHYVVRQASGCRVVRVTGVQSELEMPFAALHQLCVPLMERLPALPEPQARALTVAFGLASGTSPDRFMVGLAALNLLCEVASHRPLVVLVDDAQWLDAASAQVLGFVGRRLLAEPVMLVVAVRDDAESGEWSRLPHLQVDGLTDEDARALLAAAVTGHVDERVRDRIVAETRGNPLGLLELPRHMSPSELAGGFADPSSESLADRLLEGYVRRVCALPEPTRRLMLLASADPTGDPTLLWRAAQAFGLGGDVGEPAAQDDLLHIGSRVRFRHPLVRSAAYAAGTREERVATHSALAAATDAEADPERRVWHQAAAATGIDETVATDLERMAGVAQQRAGFAAAAAFLERSFTLSEDPSRRATRGLAAARANLLAGAFDSARTLLAESAADELDDLQRAQAELLEADIEAAARPSHEAPGRLLRTAHRLEQLDLNLARETYLRAWWVGVVVGRQAALTGGVMEVARAALAAPQTQEPRPCDLMLEGLALAVTEGRPAAAPLLRSTVDLFLQDRVSDEDWIRWGRGATSAAILLWDGESYAELSARQVMKVRESGALSELVLALNLHTNVLVWRGELDAAREVAAEQYAVKEITGARMASYGPRLLAAYRGRTDAMAALDLEAVEEGDGLAFETAKLATAVLNNGLGRYAEACAAAREVSLFSLVTFGIPELIESAVRTGQRGLAQNALTELGPHVVPGSDWAAGIEARCRALVCDNDESEHWYQEAIEGLSRTPLRPDLARAHLLYGEWLRREGRRRDARHELRTAHDTFTELGLEAFAERSRHELNATGDKVVRREVDTLNQLTPQEEHIARLARDGLTNPQIGAELYISPRTVEWHLRKVFLKLGISSRAELHNAPPPTRPNGR